MQEQLRMIRYSAPVKARPFPEGYSYKMFTDTPEEIADWVDISRKGDLIGETDGAECFDRDVRNFPDADAKEDCFFIVDKDGRRVATSTVVDHKEGFGRVHMVAALPEMRGKGIGHAMLAVSLTLLEARGVSHIVLKSDDWRLAAVKTYLDAGFRPVIFHDPESDMEARWDKILENLNYGKVEYVYEK